MKEEDAISDVQKPTLQKCQSSEGTVTSCLETTQRTGMSLYLMLCCKNGNENMVANCSKTFKNLVK